MQEAIEFGQKTGSVYEIYDPVTGKVIDWNEINVKEQPDEEWYYDDRELLWKRHRREDDVEEGYYFGECHYEMNTQNRNLRRTGC